MHAKEVKIVRAHITSSTHISIAKLGSIDSMIESGISPDVIL